MFCQSGSMEFPRSYNFSCEEIPYGSETQLGPRINVEWSKRSQWLACFVGIFVLATIGLAIAVAILGVEVTKTKAELKVERPCLSIDCVKASASITNKMDTSVDPCTNFYEYACGGWMSQNPVPVTETIWGQFEVLTERVSKQVKGILEEMTNNMTEGTLPESFLLSQDFYDTCVTQDNAGSDNSDLLAALDRVVGPNEAFNPANFSKILANLKRDVGGSYIFDLRVELDERNTSQYAIYLEPPRFGIQQRFLVDSQENESKKYYLILIQTIWKIIFPQDASRAAAIANDILRVEASLAAICTLFEERENRSLTYTAFNLTELQNLTNDNQAFYWESYLMEVFQDATNAENYSRLYPNEFEDTPNITKDFIFSKIANTTFVVRDVNYFRKLGSVLDVNYNGRDIHNYLKWKFIFHYGGEANGFLRQNFFQYFKATYGIVLPPPRWRTCADKTNAFFGMAVSSRYVQKHFPRKYVMKASMLVEDLRQAFDNLLVKSDWLDPITKEMARLKLRKMKTFTGFPNWLTNKTSVDLYYQGLESFAHPESHLYNCIQVTAWHVKKELWRLFRNKDSDEWIVDPTIVNAFYSYQQNSINFPAAVLQPPFFGMPLEALNYGAIGSVIGHEITHGFDDTGRQSGADGNIGDWWKPSTLEAYLEKSQCFVEEYENFTVNFGGSTWHVNGNNTLSENIADNGGLRQAFEAYKIYTLRHGAEPLLPGLETFTHNQLFFLAFAQVWCGTYLSKSLQQQMMTDVHSPMPFRVEGAIQNFEEFYKTWNCTKNRTETYQEWQACRIW